MTGTVEAYRLATVAAEVPGRVTERLVQSWALLDAAQRRGESLSEALAARQRRAEKHLRERDVMLAKVRKAWDVDHPIG